MQRQKPRAQIGPFGYTDPIGDMAQPASGNIDDAPTHVSQPRINADYPYHLLYYLTFLISVSISTKREHPPSVLRSALKLPQLACFSAQKA
tara:strand:- start:285 stop:557 length:273 start_codon:yes stop_codon:yes gene_type:complete